MYDGKCHGIATNLESGELLLSALRNNCIYCIYRKHPHAFMLAAALPRHVGLRVVVLA